MEEPQPKRKARVIAFYLPQFHPIPENDKWWGKGFTEWTNVGKAKPLFKGHYQPRVPADLGYYDLRMPEVREAQAEMAREAGIEGFCYWHYWFGNGKQLLERPFNEVLASGKPDFPFCLGWANHSWTNKTWEVGTRKVRESVLMEMVYNEEEYRKHFYEVLPAFKDKRYITVDGKPLFVVFEPLSIPDAKNFVSMWTELAKQNGLKGIHFVGIRQSMDLSKNVKGNLSSLSGLPSPAVYYKQVLDLGFDAVNSRGYWRAELLSRNKLKMVYRGFMARVFGHLMVVKCRQADINKHLYTQEDAWENVYPTLIPQWDRSPRSGKKTHIYVGSTPDLFREQLQQTLSLLESKQEKHKILFLQSWNEWAEGNYIEPDLKFGHGYLDVIKECIKG